MQGWTGSQSKKTFNEQRKREMITDNMKWKLKKTTESGKTRTVWAVPKKKKKQDTLSGILNMIMENIEILHLKKNIKMDYYIEKESEEYDSAS